MLFLLTGGKVVVNCGSQTPGLLVLDYLTDEVLQMLNVTGDPYVSPDSRFLVTVDNAELKISVYTVSDEGKSTGTKREVGYGIKFQSPSPFHLNLNLFSTFFLSFLFLSSCHPFPFSFSSFPTSFTFPMSPFLPFLLADLYKICNELPCIVLLSQ